MNREELIKLLQSWLTTATDDSGNPIHVIMDVDIHEIATEIIKSSLPPAEGAEEILDGMDLGEPIQTGEFYYRSEVLKAMQEYATLHAQRIAEKMVSENLVEFGNMIRDEPNGDIAALAEYFIRTINLKSREK